MRRDAGSLTLASALVVLKPEDFGMSRYIDIGSRLTGWNAVKSRVEQLELDMSDDQVKDVVRPSPPSLPLALSPLPPRQALTLSPHVSPQTAKIKELADVRTQSMDDVDTVLRVYHRGISSGKLGLRQPAIFDQLLADHKSEAGSANGDDAEGPAKKKAKVA